MLALAFLVAYAWPILYPGLSPGWRHVCTVADYVIWAVFVVEFIVRLVLTERRGDYAVRHIPDLLMVALPMLRPLRLLRFLVLLRMINRRATASLRRRVAIYVVASAGLVLLIAALAMLEAERRSPQANIKTLGDAPWWAITTMTTDGYGDRFPVTGDGRYVGAGLMLALYRPARCRHCIHRVMDDRASPQRGDRGTGRDPWRPRRTARRDRTPQHRPGTARGKQEHVIGRDGAHPCPLTIWNR